MASHTDAFGGATFIADASAWLRAQRESVREEWETAVRGGQIATCAIVTLELLRSTRDGAEFDNRADTLDQLRDVPITRSVTNAARRAYRRLAHVGPLYHRSVTLPDLLIAAAAEDAAIGVLHYDEDFDRLAEVMAFESRWIAPRGSLA